MFAIQRKCDDFFFTGFRQLHGLFRPMFSELDMKVYATLEEIKTDVLPDITDDCFVVEIVIGKRAIIHKGSK